MSPPTGGKDSIMFVVFFLNIYLAIHSIAGKNLEDTLLELVFNVHKER